MKMITMPVTVDVEGALAAIKRGDLRLFEGWVDISVEEAKTRLEGCRAVGLKSINLAALS